MENNSWILISILAYTLLIFYIAFRANLSNKNTADYMLGGRGLSGLVTAFGAGASDMSGWLLLGLPGAAYIAGLKVAWMAVALIVGAFLNWIIVAKRLRVFTETFGDSLTIPSYLHNRLSSCPKQGGNIKIVVAAVFVVFFTIYSSSGLVAGAMLTKNVLGIDYTWALLVTVSVIVLYTAVGGFLAVNQADLFQGALMLFALLVVPITIYSYETDHIIKLHGISSDFLSLTSGLTLGAAVSLFAWGLGYFGQPHILVRFMAVSSIKELPLARNICTIWMVLSLIGAIAVGLLGRVIFPDSITDPETIFLVSASKYFPPLITGILLSAVLSAVMSTVAALLLMSSSSLVEDIVRRFTESRYKESTYLLLNRTAVVIVAAISTLLSFGDNSTVLSIVAFAWSGLGAAFGPVIICTLYMRRLGAIPAILGIVVGTVVVLAIRMAASLFPDFVIFKATNPGVELLPGFVFSFMTIILSNRFMEQKDTGIISSYDKAQLHLNS